MPRTPGGELAKLLKQKEEEVGRITTHRIRIVEKNGEKLEHILTKPDPFGEEKCEKETCLLCLTDEKEKGKCKKKNIVYKIECKLCLVKGETGVYWGETARTAQLRGSEHVSDFNKQREGSHMIKHLESKHQGEGVGDPAQGSFKMKVHRKYRSPLERQLGEALNIAKAGGAGATGVMNQKEEYSRCVVPELEVSEGWRDGARRKRARDQDIPVQNPRERKRTRVARGEGTTATRHPTEPNCTTPELDQAKQQQQTEDEESGHTQQPQGQQPHHQQLQDLGTTATRHPTPTKSNQVHASQPQSSKRVTKVQDIENTSKVSPPNTNNMATNNIQDNPVKKKSVSQEPRVKKRIYTQTKITSSVKNMVQKSNRTNTEKNQKIESQKTETEPKKNERTETETRRFEAEKTHRQTDNTSQSSVRTSDTQTKASRLALTSKTIHRKRTNP